jgi:hypothetical protein
MATTTTAKKKVTKQAPQRFDNHIVGLGQAKGEDLLAHPMNYKIHSAMQQDAMRGVLDEVGWIDTVKVNQNTGFLVDGHMRVALSMREAPDDDIPVTYLDLTEEQELKALAFFDPIGYVYFTSDSEKLEDILTTIEEQDQNLQRLIGDLTKDQNLFKAGDLDMDGVATGDSDETTTPGDATTKLNPAVEIPTSHVRMVQLFLNTTTQPAFLKFCEALSEHLESDNLSDTVFKAVKYAYDQLNQS